MRDDHMLERKLKKRAQRRQCSLLIPGRRPDAQLAAGRRQCVGENQGTLRSQPQRRLVAAASFESDNPSP
jgi:hypothetical protein